MLPNNQHQTPFYAQSETEPTSLMGIGRTYVERRKQTQVPLRRVNRFRVTGPYTLKVTREAAVKTCAINAVQTIGKLLAFSKIDYTASQLSTKISRDTLYQCEVGNQVGFALAKRVPTGTKQYCPSMGTGLRVGRNASECEFRPSRPSRH